MSSAQVSELPVVVVGAGPVGLAAAAHLLERGLEPLVFEAGTEPAAAVAKWGHVRLFTPWSMNVDSACERLLLEAGWGPPRADEYPTGGELREQYLLPVARRPEVAHRLALDSRVITISRQGRDKPRDADRDSAAFELMIERGGELRRVFARAVVDASGAFGNPNPLGASGVRALGEAKLAAYIAYGIPPVLDGDRRRYAGKRVLVVGSGHSAMKVIDDLVALRRDEPGTRIVWAIRRGAVGDSTGTETLPERSRLSAEAIAHVAAGEVELVTDIQVEELREASMGVTAVTSCRELGPFDMVVAATGFRPDLQMLREVRLDLEPAIEAPRALAPLIDPRVHSCGTVPPHGAAELAQPETNFYLAGMKSYGRAPTFLMLTGYEQVRSIAAALAGDHDAASRVELSLPVASARAPAEPGGCSCLPTPCNARAF